VGAAQYPPGLPATGSGGATISDSSGTAVVKGNATDGATAVATVLDNLVALANAGAKICSVRVNGVEKTYLDLNGCLLFLTASPFIKSATANAALQVLGNRNAVRDRDRCPHWRTGHTHGGSPC
jgi:hypothetical protein